MKRHGAIAMERKKHTAVPRAALALGLFFAAPAAIGNPGFISPAMGQPAALTDMASIIALAPSSDRRCKAR